MEIGELVGLMVGREREREEVYRFSWEWDSVCVERERSYFCGEIYMHIGFSLVEFVI